jgi:flagellar basal body P-ring formation protein FlgA
MAHHIRTALLFAAAAAVLICACVLRAQEPASSGTAALKSQVAAETAVSPAATPFTREHLLATLAREITAHFNFEGDLQLELLRPWSPPARVASRWDLAIMEYPSVPSSSLMLRCRVLADGVTVTETTFIVRAQLWREAWVTRQPLTVGATFDPSMLETRRVDLLRDRDALPAAVGDQTYIFARGVPAARLLTWRDIARRPLVKKGEFVEVAAMEGMLVVTMKGLAMENGARGDIVTVRNPESRKRFCRQGRR